MKKNDLDYTLYNISNNSRMQKVIEESTKCKPVLDTRVKKTKPKGMTKIAKKAILFIALGAGIVIGVNEVADIYKTTQVKEEFASNVFESTQNYGNDTFGYDYDSLALGILNQNKDYDIDTRIYGCYTNLINKNQNMDEVFKSMSTIIESMPEKYSEEEIKACLHDSLEDYLDSKNITLQDYTTLMNQVLKMYARENKNEEQINELLGKLNGGSR